MGEHARFAPSGAHIWRVCPAHLRMTEVYPQDETPEAAEGTLAHLAASELIAGRELPEGVYTEEMQEGAELMRDVVAPLIATSTAVGIEDQLAIPSIHADCRGTPDFWAWNSHTKTIHVIDYKFGHRFVDEVENWQCVAYVAGVLDLLNAGDLDIKVQITIVQPRCYYKGAAVRTWHVPAPYLRTQVNELRAAAEYADAQPDEHVVNPGCQYCPGRHACSALQRAAYDAAEWAYCGQPPVLSSAAMSRELRVLEMALERLQYRVEGLRETVAAAAHSGQPTPFHQLKQTYGRKRWTIPDAQVIALGELLGVNLSKPGVITPTQAIKAGIDEDVIKGYIETPAGQLKLSPVDPKDVRRTFAYQN